MIRTPVKGGLVKVMLTKLSHQSFQVERCAVLALPIDDAHVHGADMKINSAVELCGGMIESHR